MPKKRVDPDDGSRGSNIGVLRQLYFADNARAGVRLAENGIVAVGYKNLWGHFGFWEALRFPEGEFEYPSRGKRLPPDDYRQLSA